jgi:hypothetical protein
VLEAMVMGEPAVCNAAAFAGLGAHKGEEVLVADDQKRSQRGSWEVFCFKHRRTVTNDNTILSTASGCKSPPALTASVMRVLEVQQRLEGSLAIC